MSSPEPLPRKQRAACYIRESDPTLLDSTTIESQAKVVIQYCMREGYICQEIHIYREAISAYTVPYMKRPELLRMLEAAERGEFDIVVVSEVRAISRKQIEAFVIYEHLHRFGIRIETVNECFGDDAMGHMVFGIRAGFAALEREQSYFRMQRGKADRVAIGKAPNGHNKAAYGYRFVDTEREVKGKYAFNEAIIYTDAEGKQWSEYTVACYIFSLLKEKWSYIGVARHLNDLGIPIPGKSRKGKPHWNDFFIKRIATNPIYTGEVYAFRYRRTGNKMIERPRDEWILLPEGTAPALIDRETFEEIQKQAARKKAESIRNNRHPDELGLLRAGHIFCGICGRKMSVWYPRGKALLKNSKPGYMCRRKAGGDTGKELNHFVQTHMPQVDRLAWEKVIDVLRHPEWVRARVYELREKNKQLIDKEDINGIITHINTSIKNLCRLASESTSDDTMAEITLRLKDLEKKKREALALLSIHKDDEREKQEIEMEIQKFEAWAEKHLSQLSDSSQEVSYEEKRLAVRMLGLRVTVYPTQGDYPCRFQFDVTMPDIVKKIHSSTIEGWIVDPALYQPLP